MASNPNPKVVSYIKRHLEKGIKLKKIKHALAEAGHPIEAIEDAAQFVFRMNPSLKKRPKTVMIAYGLILLILLGAIGIFIYYQATKTVEYVEEVEQVEKEAALTGMSDQEILLYASKRDSTSACNSIRGHNTKYYCLEMIWKTNPCFFQELIGGSSDVCYVDRAVEQYNTTGCLRTHDKAARADCRSQIISNVIAEKDVDKCDWEECRVAYYNALMPELDPSFCIAQTEVPEQCHLAFAITRKDPSICDLNEKQTDIIGCRTNISTSIQQVAEACSSDNLNLSIDASEIGYYSEDLQQLYCYMVFSSAFVQAEKGTCEEILNHADSSVKLSGFRNFYNILYRELIKSESFEPVPYWRCVDA
ncbi:hypothetical protein ACFL0V_06665 [Nanoarchaeota archaeon]